MRVAAIDLGTNSLKLTVADVGSDQSIHIIENSRVPIQLGASVMRSGRFGDETIALVADAVGALVACAQSHGASSLSIVGTSAARDAADTSDLRAAIEAKTGLQLQVISGEDEAKLATVALAHRVPGGRVVLVDVGGGSTEVAVSHDGQIELAVSLPVGAVRLKEAWASQDGCDDQKRHLFDEQIMAAWQACLPASLGVIDEVFATGGTVTALALLDRYGMPLPEVRSSEVEDHRLAASAVASLMHTLGSWPPSVRAIKSGLSAARVEVLIPGAMILQHVLGRLDISVCRVHEQGIRSGVLLRLAGFS